jgi:hypothetical protein
MEHQGHQVYKVDEQANKAMSQSKEQRHYSKNLIPTKRNGQYKILIIMRNSEHG